MLSKTPYGLVLFLVMLTGCYHHGKMSVYEGGKLIDRREVHWTGRAALMQGMSEGFPDSPVPSGVPLVVCVTSEPQAPVEGVFYCGTGMSFVLEEE